MEAGKDEGEGDPGKEEDKEKVTQKRKDAAAAWR
jgi:hypothetical protein